MADKEVQEQKYLPFHTVNEFMRDDFRLKILQEVISNLEGCPQEQRAKVTKLISKGVKLQGFRNPNLAPTAIKVRGCVSLFEKSPDFAGLVLECWSNLHSNLKEGLHHVLIARGWELLSWESDRSSLPGFQIEWPKRDNFEELIKSTREYLPGIQDSDDDISLMVVWLGNRLPYDLYD